MVSNDTQQRLVMLFGWVLAIIVVGMFAVVTGSIFYFGDGEAIRIISDLTGWWYGVLGAIVVFVLGHQITSLKAFVAQIVGGPQPSTPTPTTEPSAGAGAMPPAPVAAPVPSTPAQGPSLADAAALAATATLGSTITGNTTLGELIRGAMVAPVGA